MKCFDFSLVVLFRLQLVCMLCVSISAYQCGTVFGTTDTKVLGKRLEKAASNFLKVKTLSRWEGTGRWNRFCPLKSEPNGPEFLLHISTRVLQEYISGLKDIETEREKEIKRLCSASLLNSCFCNFTAETEESVKLYRLSESLCELWNNFNNSSSFEIRESFAIEDKKVKSLNVANVVKVIKEFGKCLKKGQTSCESKVLKRCWRGKGSGRRWRGGKKEKKERKGKKVGGKKRKQ